MLYHRAWRDAWARRLTLTLTLTLTLALTLSLSLSLTLTTVPGGMCGPRTSRCILVFQS